METKKLAAEKAVEYITDGMMVGLGTGSTSYWAIQKIGERVREGLKITTVASSEQSEILAKELNIPIVPVSDISHIDLTIDGADEVDKNFNLIKGGGGALLREKILVYNSKKFLVIVDESKLSEQLGSYPLPVEVIPFAVNLTLHHLRSMGCDPVIRMKGDQPYKTDNGNYITDCPFKQIPDPRSLDQQLKAIPGVVETGLFFSSMVTSVIVGNKDGSVKIL